MLLNFREPLRREVRGIVLLGSRVNRGARSGLRYRHARFAAAKEVLRPFQAPVRDQRPRRPCVLALFYLGAGRGRSLRRARAWDVLRVVRVRRRGIEPRDGRDRASHGLERTGAPPSALALGGRLRGGHDGSRGAHYRPFGGVGAARAGGPPSGILTRANFLEPPTLEVRRTLLLGTQVNKGGQYTPFRNCLRRDP